jgi:hypothetical protein
MTGPRTQPGLLAAGWNLLRQSHKVLWWVYVVNLVLGLLSITGLSLRLSRVLNHSLAADQLVHGMDLGHLVELLANPGVQPLTAVNCSLAYSALFLLFMLFALGGILESYVRGRHLVPGEFFQAAGAFFWRFVRLLLWTLLFLIPPAIVFYFGNVLASRLGDRSAVASLAFWLRLIVCAIVWLILAVIRICFDVAQVKAVIEDRRAMTRVLGEALALARRHLGTLFWMYFRITLIGWVGAALAVWCWLALVPPPMTVLTFLLGQCIALLWIATRLWQRACEVAWYQRTQPPALLLAAAGSDESVSPDEGPSSSDAPGSAETAAPSLEASSEDLFDVASTSVAGYVPPPEPDSGER